MCNLYQELLNKWDTIHPTKLNSGYIITAAPHAQVLRLDRSVLGKAESYRQVAELIYRDIYGGYVHQFREDLDAFEETLSFDPVELASFLTELQTGGTPKGYHLTTAWLWHKTDGYRRRIIPHYDEGFQFEDSVQQLIDWSQQILSC